MKATKLDIKCTLDVGSQGYIYFGYSSSNQGPSRVEFQTRCSDFLQLGRTAGITYSFIPMDGVRSEIVGTYWTNVFNEKTVNEIRGSASELPDKLREVLGL